MQRKASIHAPLALMTHDARSPASAVLEGETQQHQAVRVLIDDIVQAAGEDGVALGLAR